MRAQGCRLFGADGRTYLDFIAGISVVNVGHCHPAVTEAVALQARLYAHTMVYGEHLQRPQVQLAARLAALAPSPLDAIYFLTTGAEAVDAALKLAVKLTGRSRLVAFDGAYHGDTVGALACFGSAEWRAPFSALLPAVDFLPYGDFDALERISPDIAGVIVEPVQGEGGIRVPPDGWLAALRARCTATGALLIFDEIQTGLGRVGDWFAARRFGVTPDVLLVAKAVGGGMPLAGVMAPRDVLRRFAAEPPFSHITTFGGHPVSCAAGLAALNVIEREGLLENANRMGSRLMDGLRAIAAVAPAGRVREVRGVALMIGVEHDTRATARGIVERCRAAGLILETNLLNEPTIRFSPPLIVTEAEVDEALAIFRAAVLACDAG
jgi:acetylornithine/succinyldiaminopimelate/putrescine aminotransferase